MKLLRASRNLRVAGCVLMVAALACARATPVPPTEPPTSGPPTNEPATQGPVAGATATTATQQAAATTAKNPSFSGAIAISDDASTLAVVNPLNGSVSVFNVAADANEALAEIKTGDQPRTVAIDSAGRLAYVANQGSGTVSIVDLAGLTKVVDVVVGAGPYGVALTPDGQYAYVANSGSDTVSVIDTASQTVAATISIPGVQPRGIAITNNNGGQGPQFVYVTQFLPNPRLPARPARTAGAKARSLSYPRAI